MANGGRPPDTVRLAGWRRALWHEAMDGQVSPAAEEANRRLYELRAALAARRAVSDAPSDSSHSDAMTPNGALPDACSTGVASGATQQAGHLPGVADAGRDDEAAGGAEWGRPTNASHSKMLFSPSSRRAPRQRVETRPRRAKRIATHCRSGGRFSAFERTSGASGGFQPTADAAPAAAAPGHASTNPVHAITTFAEGQGETNTPSHSQTALNPFPALGTIPCHGAPCHGAPCHPVTDSQAIATSRPASEAADSTTPAGAATPSELVTRHASRVICHGPAAARPASEAADSTTPAGAATPSELVTRHSSLVTSASSPLRALFAALPPHLGWGSETLAAHLRQAIRNDELGVRNEKQRGGTWGAPAAPPSLPPPGPPAPLRLNDSSLVTQHLSLVKVHPDLALGMLRAEQAAAGRVWLLLRALDEAGRGMVSLDAARAALTGQGAPLRLCGWRRLRQLLAAGEGVFWAREVGRLRLLGPARVAAALGVARLGNRPVSIPATALLGSIGDARAHLYAAFHSGRAKLVTSDERRVTSEESARHSSLGNPISRATLAALSGACPRSQAAYERRAGVAARGNFALGERVPGGAGAPVGPAEQERAWQQGRALFRLTDHHGRQGAPGATYLAWRLPNTYGSARGHQPRPKGRQKRINRQLADLFTKGMTGNGRATIVKRYFAGAAAAFRHIERGMDRRPSAHPPLALHWPNGRTPSGAGVWRIVESAATK